jgi:hypothetical protein
VTDTILPDHAVVFVSHGGRGQPIYLCFGPGDHSVIRKQITPQQALRHAADLIHYARIELQDKP